MKDQLLKYLDQHSREIQDTFTHLHQIPEVGFQEHKTSAYLAGELEKAGFTVQTGIGGTGVVGILDSGKEGPFVGIRADMDALLHEINGVSRAVHSCGHDANCTGALWAAKALAETGGIIRGRLLVLFQPAEETLQGAKAVMESGVLEGLQYLIATHLRPMDELPYGKVSPSLLHGASGSMGITVHGQNAHGARPHQGVNAVETAASIVGVVKGIPLDPTIPHSVKATKIHSGSNPFNVIPDWAEIILDVRAQTNALMDIQLEAIRQRAEHVAASWGAKAECRWMGGVPAATRCDFLAELAEEAIVQVLGPEGLGDVVSTPGGEDFHFYPLEVPGLQGCVLGIGADLTPGLHKADMQFNTTALHYSAGTTAVLLHKLLSL